jgi:hypothetical protein
MSKQTKYWTEFIRHYKWGGCDHMFDQSLQDVIGYSEVYRGLHTL